MSIRKMEKLAHRLGIENLSRSQVSEMTKGLNEQVQDFRSRSLAGHYPIIWTDALYGMSARTAASVVGIFPNPDSYLRLVTTYLLEYAED